MKKVSTLLSTLLLGSLAYAVPSKNPTTIRFDKTPNGVEIVDVSPGEGSVGLINNKAEVLRIIDILTKAGVKATKTTTSPDPTTTYTASNIYCFENDSTVCSIAKKDIKADPTTISDLVQLLIDYEGTLADFENYAEFGMKKISCTVTKVPSIHAVHHQCKFLF